VSRLVATRLRSLVQTTGLVRKEVSQTLRQPQLLLLLVAGPFVILLIFGFGYDEDELAMRTRFVGPTDSLYEAAVSEHEELLSDYLISDGYSSDLVRARRDLREGLIDLVVVFPTDAAERLAEGEQSPIEILHDKIDPIQVTAVEIAARMAVGEVNATILETLVDRGLEGMRPVNTYLFEAAASAGELERAAQVGDTDEVASRHRELDLALAGAYTSLAASATLLTELDVEGVTNPRDEIAATLDEIQAIRDDADRLADAAESGQTISSVRLSGQVADLTGRLDAVTTLPPSVVVRPFVSNVSRISEQRVTPTDFFAPATIALLLAHLGVTFAAMSVVADRRLGVFEAYRVAPVRSGHIVVSKYLAFLLLGGIVGAALLGSVVLGLDVPLVGHVGWVVGIVALVVLASVGLGLIVSALARTDSQAVQYAMLVLLAGLFFGGFFLDLDSFTTPVRVLAAALPVTYGIEMLHDVMLRGLRPDVIDAVGLGGLTLVYGIVASVLMRWQLRAR
jgi:ABC-2 type transport system permease protein